MTHLRINLKTVYVNLGPGKYFQNHVDGEGGCSTDAVQPQ